MNTSQSTWYRPAEATVESKRGTRERLAADVEQFLANGGRVQHLAPETMSAAAFRYALHPSTRFSHAEPADDDESNDTDTEE